ncbi:copper amine oxidase N-terminal domain-containing protein [Neobacillus mesonae]|nr:copper amine oxidase N-terminal domain-containing protein [Neobacillus mesonae]
MKKVMLSLGAGVLAFSTMITSGVQAAGNTQVEVLLDTKKMTFPDAKPFQDSQGSVMVPIRFVSEALDAKINLKKTAGKTTVEVTKDDHHIQMTVGQTSALINGKSKSYGTRIILKDNRTFVPLRLISEGLGESVSWDKVGRWVWIGDKEFRSTDDKEFKLQPLSDFKEYSTKDKSILKNIYEETFKGIKIVEQNQLPIQLGTGEVIYSANITKIKGDIFLGIRSTSRAPINLLLKNDFPKYRKGLDNLYKNHGDGTGTNYYPLISQSDKFQNGKYLENYKYTDLDLKNVDYITFRTDEPRDYVVALVNPFN